MASSDLEQRVKRLEGEVSKLVAMGKTDRAELGELREQVRQLMEWVKPNPRRGPTEAPASP